MLPPRLQFAFCICAPCYIGACKVRTTINISESVHALTENMREQLTCDICMLKHVCYSIVDARARNNFHLTIVLRERAELKSKEGARLEDTRVKPIIFKFGVGGILEYKCFCFDTLCACVSIVRPIRCRFNKWFQMHSISAQAIRHKFACF